MTDLTDTERETLLDAVGFMWTPSDWLGIQDAVEAILTARLARIEALADEWDATPDADLGMSQPYAAAALRAALAAPTPTEVQP